MKKKALFSLYEPARAEEFARVLVSCGWEIIASKETSSLLIKRGIAVTDISQFTGIDHYYGFPPTLHPKIEFFLTSKKGPRIDLVYILPYPLSVGNDIGGRSILALAAKGNRLAVTDDQDMDRLVRFIKMGRVPLDFRQGLIDKANALIASHFMSLVKKDKPNDFVHGVYSSSLINGENPYQVPAALFSTRIKDTLAINNFNRVSGVEPCFTNLADADSILQTICLAQEAFKLHYKKAPFICIASKHGNPCGMGVDWKSPAIAIDKALFGSPQAVWGGEVIVNFRIDDLLAASLHSSRCRKDLFGTSYWMLDIILAPSFSESAVKILGKRKERKLFENKCLLDPFVSESRYSYRFVRGGFLRQPPHSYVLDIRSSARRKIISGAELDSLIIAWSVAWSSFFAGNEVAIANNAALLGAGGGASTLEAARLAVIRARANGCGLNGSVFCADAFFPFTDAPTVLVDAGVKAGVVPGGGKNYSLVRDFFRSRKVRVIYLPGQYRGFCRH